MFCGRHAWSAGAFVALCLAAQAVLAQGLTAVKGVVKDANGAVVPGVEVKVTNNATGMWKQEITNESGLYVVRLLLPGNYRVRAVKEGFKVSEANDVSLPVDEIVTLDLSLQVGAPTIIVDVTTSARSTNTTNAQLGIGFDAGKIIDLPLNARNIPGLLSLQTGVTLSDRSGEF